ncbi:hypothetical protein NQ315_002058 [Exocentrus adspersus]|uniref:Reverse transcriptase n=1 Tax=Exocentrus adspersus TaxID=1586481 RepID=A0AAV8VGE8_9CUCU|nr:hypothetical protein NQ315_002058 [Exocentrus adspersus]
MQNPCRYRIHLFGYVDDLTVVVEADREWKRRWEEDEDTAQWTRTIISDLEAWVTCPHRRAEYFLTQFLSGQGSFNSYLCRIGKKESDVCDQCQESDTLEHVMFHCPQFADNKLRVETRIGIRITPTNLMVQMIRSKDNWDHIHNWIRKVMIAKEREGRRR